MKFSVEYLNRKIEEFEEAFVKFWFEDVNRLVEELEEALRQSEGAIKEARRVKARLQKLKELTGPILRAVDGLESTIAPPMQLSPVRIRKPRSEAARGLKLGVQKNKRK